jgi:8-oxo-dGTP pyrophosphatase MutT (NUDIX family)
VDRPVFTLLGRRFVAQGRFITLERAYYLAEPGGWTAREVVRHPGSAAVVPWDGRRIHLLRQHRAAVGGTLLELPAGKLDVPGETPEQAARRECAEELGLRPGRLTLLHVGYTSPGFTDELTWVYLGEELMPAPAAPQGPEEAAAEVVGLSLDEAAAALEDGSVRDAKTILGICSLLRRLGR